MENVKIDLKLTKRSKSQLVSTSSRKPIRASSYEDWPEEGGIISTDN